MSFLVSDVTSEVELLTGGTTSSESRWPKETTKLRWYNDAVQRIRTDRPDARFNGDTGNLIPYAAATATTDTSILTDDHWKMAIALFVASRCLMQDAEDKRDLARAAEYMKQFEDYLKR